MTKTYSKKELEELSAIKIVDRNLADKWNPKEDFQTDTAPALNKEIQTIIQTILMAMVDDGGENLKWKALALTQT